MTGSFEIEGEQQLIELLDQYGVDHSHFGQGEAKTIAHLLKELREGECQLRPTAEGKLERLVLGSCVDVYHQGLHLIEEKQVFRDGRVRERDIYTSIGEKLHPGEDPRAAAERALQEELGIDEPLQLRYRERHVKQVGFSQSYPGLHTCYEMEVFEVELPESQFVADGYVEEQADKSTYWVWRPAEARPETQ